SKLIASGVTDEASLLAFQSGLGAEWRFHQQFIQALTAARTSIGPWAAKSFLHELSIPMEGEAHATAANALLDWQRTFGDAAGIGARLPDVVAALGAGGSPQLIELLGMFGPKSVDALKAALPTHPRRAYVVQALVALGDKTSGDDAARVLAETSD